MDFNNNNFFNPNMNSYFTPTSFDSDNSDPAIYNMNEPYMPSWDYLTQYDYNFQNDFHSSQSSWGFTSPESNFQPHYPQFSQYSFLDSASYPPFLEPPIEEKSPLQRTLEEAIEAQK